MKRYVKLIVVFVTIMILLVVGLGYVNSYFGYQAYHKNVYRRFSETIEESQSRNVFVKEVKFKCTNQNIQIANVFIEKGYRWGKNSSKKTQSIDLKDTLVGNTPALPFQVVVSFNETQASGKVSVFSGGTYHTYSPFIPILEPTIKDTIAFKLILENEKVGDLLVWDE